jgi:hypothetical protein
LPLRHDPVASAALEAVGKVRVEVPADQPGKVARSRSNEPPVAGGPPVAVGSGVRTVHLRTCRCTGTKGANHDRYEHVGDGEPHP